MSDIDATKPVQGAATTASVRANFLAAKNEIEALAAATATLNIGRWLGRTVIKPSATTAALATGAPIPFNATYGPQQLNATPNLSSDHGIHIPNAAGAAKISYAIQLPYNSAYLGTYRKIALSQTLVGATQPLSTLAMFSSFAAIISNYAQPICLTQQTPLLDLSTTNDDGAASGYGSILTLTITHDAAQNPTVSATSYFAIDWFAA